MLSLKSQVSMGIGVCALLFFLNVIPVFTYWGGLALSLVFGALATLGLTAIYDRRDYLRSLIFFAFGFFVAGLVALSVYWNFLK